MIITLIAIISIIALGLFGVSRKHADFAFFNELVCPVVVTFGFVLLVIYVFLVFDYVAAEYKANIINDEYGTSYTQADVFYASDIIEIIRGIDRNRFEVNGNLITGD